MYIYIYKLLQRTSKKSVQTLYICLLMKKKPESDCVKTANVPQHSDTASWRLSLWAHVCLTDQQRHLESKLRKNRRNDYEHTF